MRVLVAILVILFSLPTFADCKSTKISLNDKVNGSLKEGDCRISDLFNNEDESFVDVYTLLVTGKTKLTASLTSSTFDSYLKIFNEDFSNMLASSDDHDQSLNSRVSNLNLSPGTYKILANSATNISEDGRYTLTTKSQVSKPKKCKTRSCSIGEGQCWRNSHCEKGLVCVKRGGPKYGFSSKVNVCDVKPTPKLGDGDFCSSKNKCSAGQGDCDKNNHCKKGLVCKQNVGAKYGFAKSIDVCEVNKPQLGERKFCTGKNKCSAGQGDCNKNSQCKKGLVCSQNVGAKYGFGSKVDVCEAKAPKLGQSGYCTKNSRCSAGEGDCNKNNHCKKGLVCKHNVGAKYGFSAKVDVCERRN